MNKPDRTLIIVAVPLGWIKETFFRERAIAARETMREQSLGPVGEMLTHSLSILRQELKYAETEGAVNEITLRWSRISLQDWCASLPGEVPNSY